MKLALMLVLLASLASLSDASSSSGSVGLDIIGSEAEDARIISNGGGPVEVDIIGSTATNIQIGAPVDQDNCTDCGGVCYCGECSCGYTTIWDDFTRPLCYPWSSYIPTRYNKPFHIIPMVQWKPAAYGYNGYPVYWADTTRTSSDRLYEREGLLRINIRYVHDFRRLRRKFFLLSVYIKDILIMNNT
jgi:hypothetical protein